MLSPIADEKISKDHATEMGQMCHVAAGHGQCGEELDGNGAEHHPLGLDGDGDRDDKHLLVGKHHAEGEQQGIDAARGTHSGQPVELCGQLMHDRD